ncbi:MAG: hypothetical protein C0625_04965 [Arcobacter sp.]|nr:MAG: hypothetical protein C0625_04965 [Arcobacter sp.]
MRKSAFTLLEIIIVVVIISILSIFVISKAQTSIDSSIKTKIKSDIALIRNSITKVKTKKILLKEGSSILLDDANINEKNSKLFNVILAFPLMSTTKEMQEIGKWIKISSKDYMIYFDDKNNLEFSFENDSFNCKSLLSLCKEFE